MAGFKFFLKILFLLLVILDSGAANTFVRSNNALFILFGISIVYSFIFSIKLKKSFFLFLFVWSLYFILNFLINSNLNYLLFFRIIIFAYISFVLLNLFPLKIFLYLYERTILFFSIISLILFTLEFLFGNTLISLLYKVNASGGLFGDNVAVKYINIIFYTILRYPNEIMRNCGFAWEPGPFSIFVSFALLFHYLRINFSKLLSNHSLILISTILSTFSTTGYIMLFIILSTFFVYSKKIHIQRKLILYFLFFSTAIFIFFESNFLFSKIKDLFYSGLEIEHYLNNAARYNVSFSAGRFGGFYIAFKDFLMSPLFGIMGSREYSYGTFSGGYAAIISGLASIISNYGLFGIIILINLLNKSGILVSKLYPYNLKIIFILLYLVGLFSFNIHELLFFFAILFLGLFSSQNILNKIPFKSSY